MARNRMIKKEFWTDDKCIELTITERLFFIGMWNFADDEGLIANKPRQMKAQIFPVDDITHGVINEMLMRLHELGLIVFGNDNSLIKIKNWSRHQKINRPTPSVYTFTKVINEDSMSNHEALTTNIKEDKGKEYNIKEKNISPEPKKPKTKPLLPYADRVNQFYDGLSKDKDYLDQLKEAYPNVDIGQQLKASKMWLLSNTNKAKKNFKRFVNTWMSNQMEYNNQPNYKNALDKEISERHDNADKESVKFQQKMKEADKDAASDDEIKEALSGWMRKPNKYKEAHDTDVKDNAQPLKGSIDNLIRGINND